MTMEREEVIDLVLYKCNNFIDSVTMLQLLVVSVARQY